VTAVAAATSSPTREVGLAAVAALRGLVEVWRRCRWRGTWTRRRAAPPPQGSGRECPVAGGSCMPSVTIRVRGRQRFPMPCGPSADHATATTVSSGPVRSRTPPGWRASRRLVPRMAARWTRAV